jgi:hypothetical protein
MKSYDRARLHKALDAVMDAQPPFKPGAVVSWLEGQRQITGKVARCEPTSGIRGEPGWVVITTEGMKRNAARVLPKFMTPGTN